MSIKHIAIIPDGNRRYSRKNGLSLTQGYDIGCEKLRKVIEHCYEKDVKYLSVYTMSCDNLENRTDEEREILIGLLDKQVSNILDCEEDLRKYRYRFIASDTKFFSEILMEKMKKIEILTAKNNKLCINTHLSYSSKKTIIDTINNFIKEGELINEKTLSSKLNCSLLDDKEIIPDPDFLIRTSGEKRLSDYMLFELAYSELFFIDKFWPELTMEDLDECIEKFIKVKRNFGK